MLTQQNVRQVLYKQEGEFIKWYIIKYKKEEDVMKIKYNDSFDIDKIVAYLKPYTTNINTSYMWDTPANEELLHAKDSGMFNTEQFNVLISEKNMLERNVLLKKILCSILSSTNSSESKKMIFKWIVNKWGGINFKNINKLYDSVIKFLDKNNLNTQKLSFDSIASVTKVLSFVCPEKYIIYDARVAYSVNWILLKTGASKMFFPMPESRNSKLNAVDISTLIRLSNINNYESKVGTKHMISNSDKEVFIDKSMAYTTLCDLIMKVNNRLWDDDRKEYPFYTEMLIFSLADTNIFSDILGSCILNIG